jgi:hypothetical protein
VATDENCLALLLSSNPCREYIPALRLAERAIGGSCASEPRAAGRLGDNRQRNRQATDAEKMVINFLRRKLRMGLIRRRRHSRRASICFLCKRNLYDSKCRGHRSDFLVRPVKSLFIERRFSVMQMRASAWNTNLSKACQQPCTGCSAGTTIDPFVHKCCDQKVKFKRNFDGMLLRNVRLLPAVPTSVASVSRVRMQLRLHKQYLRDQHASERQMCRVGDVHSRCEKPAHRHGALKRWRQ